MKKLILAVIILSALACSALAEENLISLKAEVVMLRATIKNLQAKNAALEAENERLRTELAKCRDAHAEEPPETDPKPESALDAQGQRRQLIAKLIANGVFAKVDIPGAIPHVWVRPGFYALDFETKQKFISVVAAYFYYAGDAEEEKYLVVLYDNNTGKQAGTFDAGFGLRLK